jgi:hypothetical protein
MWRRSLAPTRNFSKDAFDAIIHCGGETDGTVDSSQCLLSPVTTAPFSVFDIITEEKSCAMPEAGNGPLVFWQDENGGDLGGPLNHAMLAFFASFMFLVVGITPHWARDRNGDISWNKVLLLATATAVLVYAVSNMANVYW